MKVSTNIRGQMIYYFISQRQDRQDLQIDFHWIILTAEFANVHWDMCTKRSLRSVCASVKSIQSPVTG